MDFSSFKSLVRLALDIFCQLLTMFFSAFLKSWTSGGFYLFKRTILELLILFYTFKFNTFLQGKLMPEGLNKRLSFAFARCWLEKLKMLTSVTGIRVHNHELSQQKLLTTVEARRFLLASMGLTTPTISLARLSFGLETQKPNERNALLSIRRHSAFLYSASKLKYWRLRI